MEQIFEFLLWKYVQNVGQIGKMSEILDIISHISKKIKIQKSVPWNFRYHIEVPMNQISAS